MPHPSSATQVSDDQRREPILSVRQLEVDFGGPQKAVVDVSLDLFPGEILGVAGQSGSGKSLTALAALGLAPTNAHINGSIRFKGKELIGASESERAKVRGSGMTMIFQETVTALNPVVQIERQMELALRANVECSKAQARERIVEALNDVQLRDVERVLHSYPYELSGGMCQRVMIAMALVCGADILFADEPTTALDVTVQREVMDIIRKVTDERELAVMLISHDIGVLDEVSDQLAVMYRGRVVETGPSSAVIADPGHPYTQALISSIPRIHGAHNEFIEMPQLDFEEFEPLHHPAREGVA
ncbi:ABC transporter ATP-binding protein [Aeromicrobium sp. Marseille-Q0843]|uniref:ABC transporter ATP-binding protein n=1 Tax=Aeromicrobium phoceense TaxID=2754045 RepID=A0A838XB55_9ACTN|nr:ABC transporter ATP-binding protein [Aeromicrobium phoceense]MBA4607142.1 ABC transporter ATP-binding protein [Aeromicrobium phoceense]